LITGGWHLSGWQLPDSGVVEHPTGTVVNEKKKGGAYNILGK
jgi:hypothetical protein